MRMSWRTGFVCLAVVVLGTIAGNVVLGQGAALPQGRAAAAGPDAVARGRQIFTQQCSFCHGPDARGGAEGGSDLTRSPILQQDQGGNVIGPFLRVGRPEMKMPPFPLTEVQAADLSAFLRSLTAPAGRGRGGAGGPVVEIVGDAVAGQAFFSGEGKCKFGNRAWSGSARF